MSLDEQKKQVLPYLQRAQEVQKVDPKIAYYCRYFAVSQGLQIQNRDKAITEILGAVMGELEKSKKNLQIDEKQDGSYCEQFAINIFNNAEKVDQKGKSTEKTAVSFYAAGIFLDICRQFFSEDQFPEDLESKQKYALWRATEIRKAIREGRPPLPPNFNEKQDEPSEVAGLQTINETTAEQPIGEQQLTAQYRPGNKVLYKPAPTEPPQPGTVGMVMSTEGVGQYKVALQQEIIMASGDQLAYQISVGDSVLYADKDGSYVEVVISQVDMSHWKPSYTVRFQDGSERDTEEYKLQVVLQQQTQQQAPSEKATPTTYGVPPPVPDNEVSTPSAYPSNYPVPYSEQAYPQYPNPYAAPTQTQFTQPGQQWTKAPVTQQQSPTPTIPVSQAQGGFQPPLQAIVEAQKKAKSAASALSFDDVPTAIKQLTEALKLLSQPVPKSVPGFQPSVKDTLDAHKHAKNAANALANDNIPSASQQLSRALHVLTVSGAA